MSWRLLILQLFVAFFALQGLTFSHTHQNHFANQKNAIVLDGCAICQGLAVLSSSHGCVATTMTVIVRAEARETVEVLESHAHGFVFRPRGRGPPFIA